jgi:hypothetical protein
VTLRTTVIGKDPWARYNRGKRRHEQRRRSPDPHSTEIYETYAVLAELYVMEREIRAAIEDREVDLSAPFVTKFSGTLPKP